jgi:hypothetical protein
MFYLKYLTYKYSQIFNDLFVDLQKSTYQHLVNFEL